MARKRKPNPRYAEPGSEIRNHSLRVTTSLPIQPRPYESWGVVRTRSDELVLPRTIPEQRIITDSDYHGNIEE